MQALITARLTGFHSLHGRLRACMTGLANLSGCEDLLHMHDQTPKLDSGARLRHILFSSRACTMLAVCFRPADARRVLLGGRCCPGTGSCGNLPHHRGQDPNGVCGLQREAHGEQQTVLRLTLCRQPGRSSWSHGFLPGRSPVEGVRGELLC